MRIAFKLALTIHRMMQNRYIFNSQRAPLFFCRLWVLLSFCILLCEADALTAKEIASPKVAVVVSLNIRPYLEALEGIKDTLFAQTGTDIQSFFLNEFQRKRQENLIKKLREGKFDIFVAIGPEAARLIWTKTSALSGVKLFTMVLNSDEVLPQNKDACGITLNISVEKQIQILAHAIPDMQGVGLLYDPKYNAAFANRAVLNAASLGMRIIPLEVSSKKKIPIVLKSQWESIDVLWLIPDRTVISESIVRYIIKEAMSNGVAVIGYNRFFYESGAMIAFVLDYRQIGIKTAELIRNIISGEPCRQGDPKFYTWINENVKNKLGIKTLKDDVLGIEAGP